ncbi:hypothetical protein ACSSVY_004441, partial [Roseovarius sp. MBR-51]
PLADRLEKRMTSKILASINPKIQLPHTLRYSLERAAG